MSVEVDKASNGGHVVTCVLHGHFFAAHGPRITFLVDEHTSCREQLSPDEQRGLLISAGISAGSSAGSSASSSASPGGLRDVRDPGPSRGGAPATD